MSLSGLRIQVYLDLSTFEKYRKLRSLSSQLYSDFVNWSQPKYQIASTSFANMPDIILALILIACVPQRKTILQAPSRYYTHI